MGFQDQSKFADKTHMALLETIPQELRNDFHVSKKVILMVLK